MKRRLFILSASLAGATGIGVFPNNISSGLLTNEEATDMIKQAVYYFEKPGPENTEKVIEIVSERHARGDIQYVVVASTSGKTARKFNNALIKDRVRLVCVTEHAGFTEGDKIDLDPVIRDELRSAGIPVIQASHVLSGIGRSIGKKFGGTTKVEMIAHTLRLLSQGTKVAVEISVMAADAGAITTDKKIIAVAGTGSGSDTAIVLHPAHMNNFFDLKIQEILAKPLL